MTLVFASAAVLGAQPVTGCEHRIRRMLRCLGEDEACSSPPT